MLGHLAFRVARSWLGRKIVVWVFARMSFLLPVQRLRETQRWIAFHHPSPAYPVHVVIVPRQALRGLQDLTGADGDLLAEGFQLVKELVADLGLESRGYRVIVNGGRYQEIPQLHFHLVSGKANREAGLVPVESPSPGG